MSITVAVLSMLGTYLVSAHESAEMISACVLSSGQMRLLSASDECKPSETKLTWNVVGPQFNDLHKFFEAQYEAIDDAVDEVAERVRTIGGRASGTLAEFVQQGRLKERPGDRPDIPSGRWSYRSAAGNSATRR